MAENDKGRRKNMRKRRRNNINERGEQESVERERM